MEYEYSKTLKNAINSLLFKEDSIILTKNELLQIKNEIDDYISDLEYNHMERREYNE